MGPARPRPTAKLAAMLTLLAAVRGQEVRSVLQAGDLIAQVGTDAPLTLELPGQAPFGRGARGPGPPEATGNERLVALIRTFAGDEVALQSGPRGVVIFGGTQDALQAGNSVLLALRIGSQTNVGLSGFLRRGPGPWRRAGNVEPDAARQFTLAASPEALKAAGDFAECVASGLVASAPGGRQMLWHGMRVTARPTSSTTETFWAHGSALLESEDDSRFEWGGAWGGSWSLRAEHSPPKLASTSRVRLLPLGPLARRAFSPRATRLAGGAPERDDDAALSQDRLREALLAKAPVAAALARAKLCLWRDFAMLSASAADTAAIETALLQAAETRQARIEVAHGTVAPAVVDSLEAGGVPGAAATAQLVHARVPTVIGQPFGLAFVGEDAGRPPRGIEVEGLALARQDGDLTLVARVAHAPPPAPADSRPGNDKRLVQLRSERWAVLERARLADGQERVVLVRAIMAPGGQGRR